MTESTIKHTMATTLVMVAFTVIGTAILAYTYETTKAPIALSEAAAKMKLFDQVLPSAEYDNDLINDSIDIPHGGELANREDSKAYVARLGGKPSAVILETTAPDGYSGDIKLLIAIRENGSLAGVRVIAHKETPGLGDYIDVAHGDWIKSFDNLSLSVRPDADWKVKKDGGQFDYMAGATITPRAVVKAVRKALIYVDQNRQTLFATQATGEK